MRCKVMITRKRGHVRAVTTLNAENDYVRWACLSLSHERVINIRHHEKVQAIVGSTREMRNTSSPVGTFVK